MYWYTNIIDIQNELASSGRIAYLEFLIKMTFYLLKYRKIRLKWLIYEFFCVYRVHRVSSDTHIFTATLCPTYSFKIRMTFILTKCPKIEIFFFQLSMYVTWWFLVIIWSYIQAVNEIRSVNFVNAIYFLVSFSCIIVEYLNDPLYNF